MVGIGGVASDRSRRGYWGGVGVAWDSELVTAWVSESELGNRGEVDSYADRGCRAREFPRICRTGVRPR